MIELERTSLGIVSVDERALVRLVRDAALAVDGVRTVRPRRGVRLEVLDGRGPAVAIVVSARRGAVLPQVGRGVQRRVADALRASLGDPPTKVDVTVDGVETQEGAG
jgi:uncharacterized alkaline shock family protein YloU